MYYISKQSIVFTGLKHGSTQLVQVALQEQGLPTDTIDRSILINSRLSLEKVHKDIKAHPSKPVVFIIRDPRKAIPSAFLEDLLMFFEQNLEELESRSTKIRDLKQGNIKWTPGTSGEYVLQNKFREDILFEILQLSIERNYDFTHLRNKVVRKSYELLQDFEFHYPKIYQNCLLLDLDTYEDSLVPSLVFNKVLYEPSLHSYKSRNNRNISKGLEYFFIDALDTCRIYRGELKEAKRYYELLLENYGHKFYSLKAIRTLKSKI